MAEIVYRDPIDKVIKTVDFDINNHSYKDMGILIKSLLSSSTTPIGSKILCLDYHGVTDEFKEDDIISLTPIIVISFVGFYSQLRQPLRESLTKRIANDQILFGVAVFKRTEEPGEKGTKEWIIKLINSLVPEVKLYFLDDSADHIKSVYSSKMKNVISQIVKSKQQVIQYIDKYTK